MAAGDSRRSSGTAMESARRASGAAIAADLRALNKANTQERKLRALSARGSEPAKRGRADWKAPAATSSGGIASPLTEVVVDGVGDREYWPAMIQETTDGLLSFEVQPIKKWKFLDADGNPVVLNIAKPEAL